MKKHVTVPSVTPSFESLLDKMTPHLRYYAKNVLRLRGDNFDDALQELTTIAYEMYLGLVKRGKEVFFTPILKYAIGHYKEGRRFAGTNQTDVLSDRTRLIGRSMVKAGDTLYFMLDQKSNVAREVGFKIDFQSWYHLQTPQDQDYITDLVLGYTQSEVARRHGVSPAAICQRQRKYTTLWNNFIDPPEAGMVVPA